MSARVQADTIGAPSRRGAELALGCTNMTPVWVAPAATICASFVGALLAFLLQDGRLRRTDTRANVAAINRVLMTLLVHARIISHYKDGAIGKYDKNSNDRAFQVERSHPFDLERYKYDFVSLDFLSSIHEQEAILQLYEEDDFFRSTLRTINIRDKLAYDEVDPAALRAGLADGRQRDVKEFRKALGEALFDAYERKTDELVECVEYELTLINETIKHFRAVAVARYPKRTIIDVDMPRESSAP